MGVVLAISPTVGQLFGAKRLHEAGRQVWQALWLALGLSLLGCLLLAFPAPFLALSKAGPEVADKVRGYLLALAVALPASLLFTVYRGFNNAVSRPKAVMALQLGGLALKVPLSLALVSGVPALGIPALGVVGCGIATALAMWAQTIAAALLMARDPFYRRFDLLAARCAAAARAVDPSAAAPGRADGPGHRRRGDRLRLHGDLHLAPGRHAGGRPPDRGQPGVAAVHAAAGPGQCQQHPGGPAHRRRRPGRRPPAGLARPAVWRGPGGGGGCSGVCRPPAGAGALHRQPGGGGGRPAPAGLGGAVPHRGRGAGGGRLCVAGLAHRHRAHADLRAGAVGCGPGRRLCAGLQRRRAVPLAWQGARGYWIASTAGLTLSALGLVALLAWVLRQHRSQADKSVRPAAAGG